MRLVFDFALIICIVGVCLLMLFIVVYHHNICTLANAIRSPWR
jgi:hypothetical protein